MRGKRDRRPGAGPPKKKLKRSKGFWAQRQTQQIPQIPQESDDERGISESEEDGEAATSHYDELVNQFSGGKAENIVDEEDLNDEEDFEEDLEEDFEEEFDEESEKEDDISEKDDEIQNSSENSETEGDEDEDEDLENSEDQVGSSKDPFAAKYSVEFGPEVKETLESKKTAKSLQKWTEIGQVSIQTLAIDAEKVAEEEPREKRLLDDEETEGGDQTPASSTEQITQALKLTNGGLSFVKSQLTRNVSLNRWHEEFFSLLNSYKDVNYNERTFENGDNLRICYVLHVLNHVLKTRTKIVNNNERLNQAKSTKNKLAVNARDQGLCRPKCLIVVPFKESARKIVGTAETLLFGGKNKGSVVNKKRFSEEYGEETISKGSKPDDFYKMFAGNTDDGFRLGMAVTKKSLKLYTDFYSSDIIVASPLGLRMAIGLEDDKDRDYDFLTSIEVMVMDQMDVFSMQNWEHVTHIFDHLHLQPLKSHGVDFSRVRMWTLNQLSAHYRQTILISSVQMPEINSLYNKKCSNFSGKVKVINPIVNGSVCRVVTSGIPIVFRKCPAGSIVSSAEERFDCFTKKIIPDFSDDVMYHTLIFIPSYFDFVQLRNWFDKKSNMDFAEICEYTKYKKMAAARDKFFHGEHHFMLYTERAHFYKRFAIKGIRHLVFYQIPQYPEFFSEMVNLMQNAYQNRKGGSDGNMSCTVLYNKYDIHRLNAVVGTERSQTMLKSDKNTHMFEARKS